VAVRFLFEEIHDNGCRSSTCQGERDRLLNYKKTIMRMKRTYRSVHLPFDIKNLPPIADDDTDTSLTCCETVRAVSRLWQRLVAQRVPDSIGPAFFDRLSSWTLGHVISSPRSLQTLLDYVEHRLCGSLYAAGTPLGLIASQSFSEPLTQMQLNQFHQSGEESELTGGVIRIKEILNCSHNIKTPSMKIVALPGHVPNITTLIGVNLRTVLETWSDIPPVPSATSSTLSLPIPELFLLLRRSNMIERGVSPRQVAETLRAIAPTTVQVLSNPSLEDSIWWVRITHSHLSVKDLYRWVHKQNPLVAGVRNIHDASLGTVVVREVDQSGHLVKRQRYCVTTLGSNLMEIFALPWVDKRHTTTNDQMEVYNELGIDAACRCIEEELVQIMMSNTASVIRKYVRIISNTICRTGMPCALTFAGMTNSNTSILKLATFERSLESFTRAAMNGHVDSLRGTSEALVVGKPVNLGTGGQFTVRQDENALLSPPPPPLSNHHRQTILPGDIEDASYLPLVHARPVVASEGTIKCETLLVRKKKPVNSLVRTRVLSPVPEESHKRRRLNAQDCDDVGTTVHFSTRVLHVDNSGGLVPRNSKHRVGDDLKIEL
jgi:hypothetical protein